MEFVPEDLKFKLFSLLPPETQQTIIAKLPAKDILAPCLISKNTYELCRSSKYDYFWKTQIHNARYWTRGYKAAKELGFNSWFDSYVFLEELSEEELFLKAIKEDIYKLVVVLYDIVKDTFHKAFDDPRVVDLKSTIIKSRDPQILRFILQKFNYDDEELASLLMSTDLTDNDILFGMIYDEFGLEEREVIPAHELEDFYTNNLSSDNINIVRYLLQTELVEDPSLSTYNVAVSSGKTQVLEYLLDTYGYEDNYFPDLLYNAVSEGHTQVIEFLMGYFEDDPHTFDKIYVQDLFTQAITQNSLGGLKWLEDTYSNAKHYILSVMESGGSIDPQAAVYDHIAKKYKFTKEELHPILMANATEKSLSNIKYIVEKLGADPHYNNDEAIKSIDKDIKTYYKYPSGVPAYLSRNYKYLKDK